MTRYRIYDDEVMGNTGGAGKKDNPGNHPPANGPLPPGTVNGTPQSPKQWVNCNTHSYISLTFSSKEFSKTVYMAEWFKSVVIGNLPTLTTESLPLCKVAPWVLSAGTLSIPFIWLWHYESFYYQNVGIDVQPTLAQEKMRARDTVLWNSHSRPPKCKTPSF